MNAIIGCVANRPKYPDAVQDYVELGYKFAPIRSAKSFFKSNRHFAVDPLTQPCSARANRDRDATSIESGNRVSADEPMAAQHENSWQGIQLPPVVGKRRASTMIVTVAARSMSAASGRRAESSRI